MIFYDRKEAGKILAQKLIKYRKEHPFVLALPRGGLPVGFEVAKTLQAPLSVIVVRKLGAPGNQEFGIGAIAENNVQLLNQPTIDSLGILKDDLAQIISQENKELKRRVKLYRQDRELSSLKDLTVILVDDGLATGISAKAAIKAIKKHQPKKIIFASPVCALDSAQDLRSFADDVVCVVLPPELSAVALWYKNFPQLSDQEVIDILKGVKREGK